MPPADGVGLGLSKTDWLEFVTLSPEVAPEEAALDCDIWPKLNALDPVIVMEGVLLEELLKMFVLSETDSCFDGVAASFVGLVNIELVAPEVVPEGALLKALPKELPKMVEVCETGPFFDGLATPSAGSVRLDLATALVFPLEVVVPKGVFDCGDWPRALPNRLEVCEGLAFLDGLSSSVALRFVDVDSVPVTPFSFARSFFVSTIFFMISFDNLTCHLVSADQSIIVETLLSLSLSLWLRSESSAASATSFFPSGSSSAGSGMPSMVGRL